MIPTIEWLEEGKIKMIDQTKLPTELMWLVIENYEDLAKAIKVMNIRGAPAIGVAAAMGMALAARQFDQVEGCVSLDSFMNLLEDAGNVITATRPTAVNLFWAVDRILRVAKDEGEKRGSTVHGITEAIVAEAQRMWQEDVDTNRAIGTHGAEILADGDTVLTHCNAGSLATVQYGTALAPIRVAVEQGKDIQVIADETRPRLQGARLTAYELHYDEIPVKVISDNSAGLLMQLGKIQKIIVGADRIVKDAVFNKIGTLMVAIVANHYGIPFYVAAPRSTLSMDEVGDDVTIEQRGGEEVAVVFGQVRIVPEGVDAMNYAFDRTPLELVTGIITEDGVFSPDELLAKYA